MNSVEIILYVSDQNASTKFYEKLLDKKPVLFVPGMTSFQIVENCRLGLMPSNSIAKILQNKTPHPDNGSGIPRCELYVYVDDIHQAYKRAIDCGASLISDIALRDWGDYACYFADCDGHIIAFARK